METKTGNRVLSYGNQKSKHPLRLPITKLPTQAYIQTIYVWKMKYKQYPIWQTTLTHN